MTPSPTFSKSKYGRSVLITGSSTGIGRACALHLDRLGFQVFAAVRKEEDARLLQAEASGRLVPLLLDVTDAGAIAGAYAQLSAAVGETGLSGLVNNAGVARAGPVEFIPLDDYRFTMEVNLFGVIAITRTFIPLLRLARGRVVNMSSVSGLIAAPFVSPYNTSKFALEALTNALRSELRPWGIHVAIVNPGRIDTPIWDKSLAAIEDSMQGWPPAVEALYGSALEAARRSANSRRGIPAVEVARAVEHALTASRPKTRYLVGLDARLVALLRLLPARAIDWLIARRLPDYGEGGP